ncbi:MAG: hypothetical protein WC307_01815 [Candidatus Nanoarchaeia archaeon]|jgi:hypothetical protein
MGLKEFLKELELEMPGITNTLNNTIISLFKSDFPKATDYDDQKIFKIINESDYMRRALSIIKNYDVDEIKRLYVNHKRFQERLTL